jgi:DNA-binding transcriptional LysR family regulator
LALGDFADVPQHFHVQPLFEGGFVCVLRRNHPLGSRKLTLRRFVQLGHILVDSQTQRSRDSLMLPLLSSS